MTVLSSRNALKRRTWALFMFFFLPGLLMASWATRTPAIRDILPSLPRKWGRSIRAFYRFNERYSLFRLAGETIWHPKGYSHDDDLRSNRDGYS